MSNAIKTAAYILNAASDITGAGRFGENKVFIAALYADVGAGFDSIEEFKTELLSLAHKGLLSLCRADLVGAMNKAMVKDSLIDDGVSTFHFVVV